MIAEVAKKMPFARLAMNKKPNGKSRFRGLSNMLPDLWSQVAGSEKS
jgi:hypothetical protein